ncbi:aldolase [Virgibacillus indicus]|uniref:Aldolase n=1 Tax=Virgibacillus indicus TaxID=2024554 RepID=A0A265NBU2_9BACI|nr:aldolase [Virgibacillus indicus]OZU89265.1 aldolase [Virgibacillus indicus]
MFETAKIALYTAFGFKVSSDFLLPELNHISYKDFEPDLIIKKEDLSNLWSEYVEIDSYYYIKENFCMFKIPGVAIYKIEDGRYISFSPIEGSNEDQIRLYLLGTCMGVALMQRKILPIHGSCIAIDGKAYAVVGDSGAGKSTLASAFINRGFKLLTDDVIAVTLSKDNTPFVVPSYPQQKLWQESLDHFGMESNQFRPVYDRVTKFAVPVNNHFYDQPLPLAGIFVLSKAEQNAIEIMSIQELERFPVLYYNTYRNFMINRLGLLEWHFEFSANMVNKLDFHRIIRPSSCFTANELVDNILNVINKENKIYPKGEKVI